MNFITLTIESFSVYTADIIVILDLTAWEDNLSGSV